ncbi:MAG: hypothetical protein AAF823_13835 [Planctomycetota bacterium]
MSGSSRVGVAGVFRTGLWRGWKALRANALPGVVLWVVAAAIVAGYFAVEPVTGAMDALGGVKERYGFLYSAASTVVFGAAIPWVVTRWRLGARGQGRASFALLLAVFWAVKGVEIDLLYRVQAWVWGTGNDAATVAAKVATDMLVYMPWWAVPTTVAAYALERHDYSVGRWWRSLDGRWVGREVVPIVVANWAVWVPAVAGIYVLPLALQIPMQNLVLCLWALMLIFMIDEGAETEGDAEDVAGDAASRGAS